MLTDHETRRDTTSTIARAAARGPEPARARRADEIPRPRGAHVARRRRPEEMEEPSDSPFRGMWIGIAAAAVTFVLVFAIPQWLGWYDIGPPPQAKREATPEAIISTVTAKPSGAAVVETGPPAVAAVATPPATAPPVSLPKAPRHERAGHEGDEAPPPPDPRSRRRPGRAARRQRAARPSRRTFTVQIAAFKNAKQAGQLAEPREDATAIRRRAPDRVVRGAVGGAGRRLRLARAGRVGPRGAGPQGVPRLHPVVGHLLSMVSPARRTCSRASTSTRS